ncbi:vacuolar protein sorting-associated protein 18 [Anaeramoeba flamelloides]|uniref:Vacuolar protein sorting-associated protein 18 n=1 Tax=Anaeramoeba flamelloides TaxID=1746091 RepID=A0AAV7Y791_9EUKA|nr:vacuolar protein sorting-associated protein 18 [Anaeramoeba flamelloides]
MHSLIDDFYSETTNVNEISNVEQVGFNDQNEDESDSNKEEEIEKFNKPVFLLQQVSYSSPSKLRHVFASNDCLVLALQNNKILRIVLSDTDNLEDIIWTNENQPCIYKLFLSPNGRLMIISSLTRECYIHKYMKKSKNQLMKIEKLQDEYITSVCWEIKNQKTQRESALIGTNTGKIYFLDLKKNKKVSIKELYQIPNSTPIHGIYFHPVDLKKTTWILLVTTNNTIFQFFGVSTIQSIFENYFNTPPRFVEFPGNSRASELHIRNRENFNSTFCFLNESGIFNGDLITNVKNLKIGNQVITNENLFYFPTVNSELFDITSYGTIDETIVPAISMVKTDYHFLLAWEEKILAISSLTNQIIFQKNINDNKQREEVHQTYAKHLFNKKLYNEAATILAKTDLPLEDVTLKLLQLESEEPLKIYLLNKIDNIPEKNKNELTLISMWLLELYVSELHTLEKIDKLKYKQAKNRFKNFVLDRKNDLNSKTTFSILLSYNRFSEMVYYASIIDNYEQILSYYIRQGNVTQALEVLRKQKDLELIYRFSPILIVVDPFQTIKTWKLIATIDPVRLLPSLMRYQITKNPKGIKTNLAIQYLEYCIFVKGNKDSNLHNYLITQYVENDEDKKLLEFLNPINKIIFYNPKYALRVCMMQKKIEPSVYLYSEMGLFEQAIKLALTIDIELARIQAEKSTNPQQKKKLWLIIAQHIATKKKDLIGAIHFLQQIEDIELDSFLPLFPNFDCIDEFKNDITTSLSSFQKKINKLKKAMESDNTSSEIMRDELNTLRKRFVLVQSDQKCLICGKPLKNSNYYIFTCKHAFHTICLENEMCANLLPKFKIKRIIALKKLKKEIQEKIENRSVNPNQLLLLQNQLSSYQIELESLIASDCILCGRLVSVLVEKPLIESNNTNKLDSWKL